MSPSSDDEPKRETALPDMAVTPYPLPAVDLEGRFIHTLSDDPASPQMRIAVALERIAEALEQYEQYQAFAAGYAKGRAEEASPPDTHCVAHVEESPIGEHADGRPIYGPGRRCGATGKLRDDGKYRCDEHEAARQAYLTTKGKP